MNGRNNMKENEEIFYILDNNLYKIEKKDNKLICLLYINRMGFVAISNPFDIMLNGQEIDKKDIFKYIIN